MDKFKNDRLKSDRLNDSGYHKVNLRLLILIRGLQNTLVVAYSARWESNKGKLYYRQIKLNGQF